MGEKGSGAGPDLSESEEERNKALRDEVRERFPQVDADRLAPEDLAIWERSKTGISRDDFSEWATSVTLALTSGADPARAKLVAALSREMRTYEAGQKKYTLPPPEENDR